LKDSLPGASATDPARTTRQTASGRRGLIDLARLAVEDTVRLFSSRKFSWPDRAQGDAPEQPQGAVFLGIAAFCGLLFFIMLLVLIALIIPAHAWSPAWRRRSSWYSPSASASSERGMLKIGPPPRR